MKQIIKKAAALLLFVCVVFGMTPGVYGAVQTATSISGLKKTVTKKTSSSVKDTITIKNPSGRKLMLQMYKKSSKSWVTKKTYQLGSESTDQIQLSYPSDWKKKLISKWRIEIPSSNEAEGYISQKVTIYSQNIKNIKLGCKSAVIISSDEKSVLYQKKMNQKRSNASTTKIMTALICLKKNTLNGKVTFSKKAAKTAYGSLNAKKGEKFYVKDLLAAMLIESSNDASTALAEDTAGSVKKFCAMMNAKAKSLKLKHTHFKNAHGLYVKNHYSSAYDLAVLEREAMKNNFYEKTVKKKTYTFRNVKKNRKYKIKSTNELLKKYKGMLGGKTGWHRQAGGCFVGVYKYHGQTYIFSVLGSKSSSSRWKDAKKVINYIQKYGK